MDPPRRFFGERPLIGRFEGNTLSARKRISYRNSFQETVRARLIEAGRGTRLECRFAMSPFVIVFMVVWLGVVGTAGTAVWTSMAADIAERGMQALDGQWTAIGIPLYMLVGGVGLLIFGRVMAARDRTFVAGLLQRATQARLD